MERVEAAGVQVDVECPGHPSGVLQPLRHIVIELLTGDLLPAGKHSGEPCGRVLRGLAEIAAQPGGHLEHLQILLGHEVGIAAVLRHMEHGEAAGGFLRLLVLLLLLPDLLADAAVLRVRDQGVDELVQVLIELVLHCLTFQLAAQRVVPSPVEP